MPLTIRRYGRGTSYVNGTVRLGNLPYFFGNQEKKGVRQTKTGKKLMPLSRGGGAARDLPRRLLFQTSSIVPLLSHEVYSAADVQSCVLDEFPSGPFRAGGEFQISLLAFSWVQVESGVYSSGVVETSLSYPQKAPKRSIQPFAVWPTSPQVWQLVLACGTLVLCQG